MKYEVVILKSAEQDFRDLRTYLLKKFGVDTWWESLEIIKAAIDNLKTFPFSGVTPDALEHINLTQYRQVLAGKNWIIYELRQRIVHCVYPYRRRYPA